MIRRHGAQALPPHPRVLLDRADIEALKERIAQNAWAGSWTAYRAAVDGSLAQPADLPPRGGNWRHYYVCPEHGVRLVQGQPVGPWKWEHRCPVGPHILYGNPCQANRDFDGTAIMEVHVRFARLLVDAGVVYQVTGDRRYAAKAREILLDYAGAYRRYALHDNDGQPGKGGRVASQSLTEASWLIEMAQGADLIWDALTPDERRLTETNLLRPALDEVILPHRFGIHNIQCWHNAAIGLVGFLLDDDRLVRRAIDDPGLGFREQIRRGVRDDGMWYEGASGYHFFALGGLWPLAEAARHAGIDLYSARFKSMFDGPLAQAMPNLSLPNFNDSVVVPLGARADLYELAYARWHDPHYAILLAGSERKGGLGIWFGLSQLPATEAVPARGSRHSAASGYATLMRGTGPAATWLCVKYGPHGGAHGHNDKNHFILYGGGRVVMPDAGMHLYGSPLHDSWDRTSVAHNTLVVDEQSQACAEGRCLAFGTTNGVDYVVTEAGPVYKGVQFVRAIALLNEQLVVVVDRVQADTEHVFDVACHVTGAWQSLPDGRRWTPPSGEGFQHMAGATARTCATGLTVTADAAITLAGGVPTEIITGTGVGASTEDQIPMLLFRRHARETAFVWAVSLDRQPVTLAAESRAKATLVTVRSGKEQWGLSMSEDGDYALKVERSTP